MLHNGGMDIETDAGLEGFEGFDGEYGYCTLPQASELMHVGYLTLTEWVHVGKVRAKRFGRTWLLPLGPDGLPQLVDNSPFPFVAEPPVGYLPLPEAAKARGISRQRLYRFVQEGRVPGCVRSKGTGHGLVIWVPPGGIQPPKVASGPALSPEDTLTAHEAAKAAGLKPQYFYTLLNAGRVEGAQRYGRGWLVPKNFKIVPAPSRGSRQGAKAPEGWIGVPEAVKQYGVSRQTLIRAANGGRIASKRVGGRWVFPPPGLDGALKPVRPEEPWLAAEEAAEERGVSVKWLREQARRGDIEARKIGHNWYFPSMAQAKPAQRHNTGLAPRGWVDSDTAAKQRGLSKQQLAIKARMGLIEAQKLGGRWFYPPIDKLEDGE